MRRGPQDLAQSCWEDKCDEFQEGTVRFHPREVSSVEAAREDNSSEKLTVGGGELFQCGHRFLAASRGDCNKGPEAGG